MQVTAISSSKHHASPIFYSARTKFLQRSKSTGCLLQSPRLCVRLIFQDKWERLYSHRRARSSPWDLMKFPRLGEALTGATIPTNLMIATMCGTTTAMTGENEKYCSNC